MLKTLENSLDLLEYFTAETPSWGVRELAKEMGFSHSIVYRILATYEKRGFLRQNPHTKKYELGLKFWGFGRLVQEQMKITDVIRPILENMAEEIHESIFLTWLDGEEGVCVEIAEAVHVIKYSLKVGHRTPLYAGASNKVIMAYLPKEVQASIISKGLKPRTAKTIVEADKLIEDLEGIRKQGWQYSVGEYSDDIFGIAVPVFSQGQITASLTAAGPVYRMPQEKVPYVLDILRKGRDEMEIYIDNLYNRSLVNNLLNPGFL